MSNMHNLASTIEKYSEGVTDTNEVNSPGDDDLPYVSKIPLREMCMYNKYILTYQVPFDVTH